MSRSLWASVDPISSRWLSQDLFVETRAALRPIRERLEWLRDCYPHLEEVEKMLDAIQGAEALGIPSNEDMDWYEAQK